MNKKTISENYSQLKAKYPNAILLFRGYDNYEAYEDDAKACADILGVNISKYDDGIATSFKHYNLDTYLPKLIRAGRRVAICDKINKQITRKKLKL